MKKSVELTDEFLDELIVGRLSESREILEEDLVNRKNGDALGIFSMDREEDIRKIKKMIKSLNRVIKYHSVPQ
jgi:hypothetical protein